MTFSSALPDFALISSMAALAVMAPSLGPAPPPLPAWPGAVQTRANTSLSTLSQQQEKEDQTMGRQPSSGCATMNGPVIRELEKRKQRQALIEMLQNKANQGHNCRPQGCDFSS